MFLSKGRERAVCKKNDPVWLVGAVQTVQPKWSHQSHQTGKQYSQSIKRFSNRVPSAYVLLLGQMVYIFVFISYFGFSDSWVLFRTELYMNWIRTMLMIRPVTILILVSKGNSLILTGPSLKDSSLTSADLRNLKSASDTGFETAEPRRTHRSTCFLIFQCFSDHKWASIQRNYYWRASL